MDRCDVVIRTRGGLAETEILVADKVFLQLGLSDGGSDTVRFGICSAPAHFRADPDLSPDEIAVSSRLARRLSLETDLRLAIRRDNQRAVVLGPLVGLLISQHKLDAVLGGAVDSVYCAYARYAREIGSVLCFMTLDGLDPNTGTVRGYVLGCEENAWEPCRFPVPAVIYDRAFGEAGRAEASRVRELSAKLGYTVVNWPLKITKLAAFEALGDCAEVQQYLPFTAPLTPEALTVALESYGDLYVKPNALYKGKGVLRLTRHEGGWILQEQDEKPRVLCDRGEVERTLGAITGQDAYVIQEGLPLATYFGNRFDFRSLVQKTGRLEWKVTGLVARLAPVGGTITSPRSGGRISEAKEVLRHAFADQWESVLDRLKEASVLMAKRLDETIGPCVDLGLDLGVLEDGSVKLIEANGKPLRVSLKRLRDPVTDDHIDRLPIECAAAMNLNRALEDQAPQKEGQPMIGVLLGSRGLARLQSGDQRYHDFVSNAREAGIDLCFFPIEGIDRTSGMVAAWVWEQEAWDHRTVPIPDVIYNRATFAHAEARAAARQLLRKLVKYDGVVMLNGINAFGKSSVYDAIRFFSGTADLCPDTIPFTGSHDVWAMLERHGTIFIKADHSSHASDVMKVEPVGGGWQVRGRYRGGPFQERFRSQEDLITFLTMLKGSRTWVIQQTVNLARLNGRIFDIRTIVQKNGDGEWMVPLVLLRLAQPGEMVTNMIRGAEPLMPDELKALVGDESPLYAGLEEKARQASLTVATALEARYGRLGEIGIDIGLDWDGRLWVLEANSKPYHPNLPGLSQPLFHLPLRYAAYLAAQTRRKDRLPH